MSVSSFLSSKIFLITMKKEEKAVILNIVCDSAWVNLCVDSFLVSVAQLYMLKAE